jgi:hypothetical protein
VLQKDEAGELSKKDTLIGRNNANYTCQVLTLYFETMFTSKLCLPDFSVAQISDRKGAGSPRQRVSSFVALPILGALLEPSHGPELRAPARPCPQTREGRGAAFERSRPRHSGRLP